MFFSSCGPNTLLSSRISINRRRCKQMSSFFIIIKCNLSLAIPLKDICLMPCSLRLSPLCSPSWWSCRAHRDLLLQGRPGGLGFKLQLHIGIGVKCSSLKSFEVCNHFFSPLPFYEREAFSSRWSDRNAMCK